MDGAIVVSPDLSRILYANVLLTPDPTIPTLETGTRHMAGERTAKQAQTSVIIVSERRKKTTLCYDNHTYILKSSDGILRDVASTLQVLEKQREIFDELLSKLNILEMSELVSVSDICKVIQRAEIILKTSENLKKDFTELGKEGVIMNMRYKELLRGVERTEEKVIRDYGSLSMNKTQVLLSNLTFDGLLDLDTIARIAFEKPLENAITTKGYRFLSHLNLTEKEISDIITKFENLSNIFKAKIEDFGDLFGARSENIVGEIENLREQILSGKVMT
jgi:diadenylate cyclase